MSMSDSNWTWTPPIEMPTPLPVNKKSFDLSYQQEITPVGAGFIQTIERASPYWVAAYETPTLSPDRDQLFQKFLDDLGGSEFTFLGYDLRRTRPYAYRSSGGNPWTANLALNKVIETNYATSSVRLTGFAAGATLTSGDYISYQDGYVWRLHRLKETVVADGSGNISWVRVTPRPVPLNNVCVLRLTKACAEMKVVGKVTKQDQVDNPGPSYSFAAVQFINRGHP